MMAELQESRRPMPPPIECLMFLHNLFLGKLLQCKMKKKMMLRKSRSRTWKLKKLKKKKKMMNKILFFKLFSNQMQLRSWEFLQKMYFVNKNDRRKKLIMEALQRERNQGLSWDTLQRKRDLIYPMLLHLRRSMATSWSHS